jgi:hypothetical protein
MPMIVVEVQAWWPCEAVAVARHRDSVPKLHVQAAVRGRVVRTGKVFPAGQTYAVVTAVLMMVCLQDGGEVDAARSLLLQRFGRQGEHPNET